MNCEYCNNGGNIATMAEFDTLRRSAGCKDLQACNSKQESMQHAVRTYVKKERKSVVIFDRPGLHLTG
jgi:hypothetical protein